jgi:hypothetical protein
LNFEKAYADSVDRGLIEGKYEAVFQMYPHKNKTSAII